MRLPSFSFTNSGVKADRKAPDFSPQDCLPSLCLSFLTWKGGSFQHFLDVPGIEQRSLWKGAWQVLAGEEWARWRSHPPPRCLFQPRSLLSRGGTQSPRSEPHPPGFPGQRRSWASAARGPRSRPCVGACAPQRAFRPRWNRGLIYRDAGGVCAQRGGAAATGGPGARGLARRLERRGQVPGAGGRRSGRKGHVLGEQGHVTLSWVSAWGWGRRLGWEGARSHWGLV